MGGAVTYLANVLRHLPPASSGHEFHVFLPAETGEKLVGLAENIHLWPLRIGYSRWWNRIWWEQITLRRQINQIRADALFCTANFAMFRCPVRQVLLVRTRLYFSPVYLAKFARLHSRRFRWSFALRRWLCRQSIRWSDVVMTPSQTMLDELHVYADCPESKIAVNYYGVADPVDQNLTQKFVKRAPPFRLLYISLYAEHKNLTTLLKALPLINKNDASMAVLATTANPNWEGAGWTVTHKEDANLARRKDIVSSVEFVGPLGKGEVEEQYRRAHIFVFPSLTESFGHPMAEAMAHGLPIVAADTPINREMCGDAAVYFSPLEPDDLARAICLVAADHSLRTRLSLEGRRRVRAKFRWDAHVNRILEIASEPRAPGFQCAISRQIGSGRLAVADSVEARTKVFDRVQPTD